MKINPLFLIFFLTIAGITFQQAPLGAVNSGKKLRQAESTHQVVEKETQTNKDQKKETKKKEKGKKMDSLSLLAHVAVSTGIASFFILPAAGLLLFPAGFVMGVIALAGGRKRYAQKRGRGLALAAVVVGGAYTALLMAALTVFILTF